MICKYKNCNKNCEKEYCFVHKPKKPLSSGKGLKKSFVAKPKEPDLSELIKKQIEAEKLKEFFIKCWNNKPHYCEITGKYLGNQYSSLYLHHLLPKSKYKEAVYDEDNIIVLHPDIHASVELDMYRYEEINKRREQLLKKYGY